VITREQKVPSKEMKIFKKQMTLTDTEKNNLVYRHALRRAKPPLVPYVALFSKDLFSLEEGVPTTLSAEEDATISLINFDKLRLLYQLLKEFRQLQQTPYSNLDGYAHTSARSARTSLSLISRGMPRQGQRSFEPSSAAGDDAAAGGEGLLHHLLQVGAQTAPSLTHGQSMNQSMNQTKDCLHEVWSDKKATVMRHGGVWTTSGGKEDECIKMLL
jgi:hypothetical protein